MAPTVAADVRVTGSELIVTLVDGRIVSVRLEWFPRLRDATPEQRGRWELLGDGDGIHWPDLDEDLSVLGLLLGNRPGTGRA